MSPLRKLTPLSQRIVGVIILLLALMTLGSTVYYNYVQRATTRCQAQFNEKFIEQLNARNRIADNDRESLSNLVKAVTNARSREDSHKALENYLRTKEKNDAERREHPLPSLPEESAHC